MIDIDHFCGSNSISSGIIFHPNGKNYIRPVGSSIVISDLNDSNSDKFLRYHDEDVTCVCLSRNGKLLASGQGGHNADVVVWDFDHCAVVYVFQEHDYFIQDVCFSLDGRMLASLGGKGDEKLMLWDMSNGAIISSTNRIPKGTTCIRHGGFIKDVKRRDTDHYLLISGGEDGLVYWDIDPYSGSIECNKFFCETKRSITSISFSPDFEAVIASTSSGDSLMYSLKSFRLIKLFQYDAKAATTTIIGPTIKNEFIAGSMDGVLRVIDILTGSVKAKIDFEGGIVSMSNSPDDLEAIVLLTTGTIIRCNLSNLQNFIISESHSKSISGLSFHPSKFDRFASSSADGTIRIWDITDYSVQVTARRTRNQGIESIPLCLAYDAMLLSGWSDGKIIAHDCTSGSYLWHIEEAHVGGVSAIAVSHNGRFILSGGANGELRLWDIRSGELISNMKEHSARITSIVITDDDTEAVTASKDKSILRWDLRSERRLFSLTQRMGGINGIVMTVDEQTIISVGQEKKLTFWSKSSSEPLHQQALDGELEEGRCIARSTDGKYIATGGSTGTLRLWDADSAKLKSSNAFHSQSISSIAFSPDGKQIVAGSDDGSVSVWNIF